MKFRNAGGLLLVLVWALPAQTPPAPIATVAGASVRVSGAPVALNAGGRMQIYDGAHLRVASAAGAAQLDLTRGGAIRVCGPARLGLAAGGGGALLISLDTGGLEMRYASPVADSLLTPDFRVTTVVPPQQVATVSANAALAADGTLCLSNRGSALAVENLWNGQRRYLVGGQSLVFHPDGQVAPAASCPCAAAPPPPAPAAPSAAEGALFPAAPALTVNAHPDLGALTPAPPPRPAPHHNFLVRFFRWLAGKGN